MPGPWQSHGEERFYLTTQDICFAAIRNKKLFLELTLKSIQKLSS